MSKNTKKEDNQTQDEVNRAIIGMLKNSEGDLSTYRRDYKKRDYWHAVTNMQQAVEKLGKSIIALLKDFTERDLRRKVDHKIVDFLIGEIEIKLDEIKEINPEIEQFIREIIFDKLHPDFKKQFHTKDDLFISYNLLKRILNEYDFYEKLIKTGEFLMFDNFPMEFALSEFRRTKDNLLHQVEEEHNIELTNEQKNEVAEMFQNKLESEGFFQEIRNTLYILLLLGYVAILHSNLEKHQSSSRYDLEREERYSEESELVQILPLMSKILKKMINVWYYLIYVNNPELESENSNK